MSRYVQGEDRNQISIEPLCLDDMLAEDNPVRAIEAIVESMDIPHLGFTYSETKETGRKPYNPEDMFKLYAYSYFNGIRSSRKIERECHRNIEVMWLIGELKPDFKTIANFRKDNKKAIKAAFRRFSMICAELGLISKEVVAVDGSKFRACNGRMRYHSKGKIAEKMKYYTEAAEKYMNLLEQCDREDGENPQVHLSRQELLEKLEKIKKRMAALEEISERVEAEGTIYLTDPDARLMRTHNGGGDISHNVQVAVEAANHFIVAVDVVGNAVDHGELSGIAKQAKEELQVEELIAIADCGYYSGEDFSKCKAANITPIVPKADCRREQEGGYSKTYFRYYKERDLYICPQGNELSRTKPKNPNSEYKKYVNKKACLSCTAKGQCTSSKNGRVVTRDPFNDYSDEVDAFTAMNKDLSSMRKELVEHPFGTVKRALGFTYFLTRGFENVRTESLLHFLAYNMKRLINIVGTENMRLALQG